MLRLQDAHGRAGKAIRRLRKLRHPQASQSPEMAGRPPTLDLPFHAHLGFTDQRLRGLLLNHQTSHGDASDAVSASPWRACMTLPPAISVSTTRPPNLSSGPSPPMPSSKNSAVCLKFLYESETVWKRLQAIDNVPVPSSLRRRGSGVPQGTPGPKTWIPTFAGMTNVKKKGWKWVFPNGLSARLCSITPENKRPE